MSSHHYLGRDDPNDPTWDWAFLEQEHTLLLLPEVSPYQTLIARLETRDIDRQLHDVCWYLIASGTHLEDLYASGPMPEIATMAAALELSEDVILDELAWLQNHGSLTFYSPIRFLPDDSYRLSLMALPARPIEPPQEQRESPTLPPTTALDWGDTHGMGAL